MLPFEIDSEAIAGDLVFLALAFFALVAILVGVWRLLTHPTGRWSLGVLVAGGIGYVVMGHWLDQLLIAHGLDVAFQRVTVGIFGAAYLGGTVLSYRYRGAAGPIAMLFLPILCYGGWAVLGPLYADLVEKLNLADVMPWGSDYTGRVCGLVLVVAAVVAGLADMHWRRISFGLIALGLAILITRMNSAWNDLDRGLTSSFKASVHAIEQRKKERDSSQAIRDVEEKARGATELKDVYEYNAQLAKLRKQNDKAYEAEMAALNAERGPRQAEIRAMSTGARIWATFREALGPALVETAVGGILTGAAYGLARRLAPGGGAPSPEPPPAPHDGEEGGGRGRRRRRGSTQTDSDAEPLRGKHPGVEGVTLAHLSADAAHGLDPDAGTWRGLPLADAPGRRRPTVDGVRQSARLWPRLAGGDQEFIGSRPAMARAGRQPGPEDATVVPFKTRE